LKAGKKQKPYKKHTHTHKHKTLLDAQSPGGRCLHPGSICELTILPAVENKPLAKPHKKGKINKMDKDFFKKKILKILFPSLSPFAHLRPDPASSTELRLSLHICILTASALFSGTACLFAVCERRGRHRQHSSSSVVVVIHQSHPGPYQCTTKDG
jgi:hypothetical protein